MLLFNLAENRSQTNVLYDVVTDLVEGVASVDGQLFNLLPAQRNTSLFENYIKGFF